LEEKQAMYHISKFIKEQWLGSILIVLFILFLLHGIGKNNELKKEKEAHEKLKSNIIFFNQEKMRLGLKPIFVYSKSAIQCAIIPGNERVKNIASQIQQKGFDVRPILSPTVPEGQERLRVCLHSYNSEKEISEVLHLLSTFVF
jgi:8-amino-7-oxononanoate synthase